MAQSTPAFVGRCAILLLTALPLGRAGAQRQETPAGRQLSSADYAHAERLDRRGLYGKVKNALVVPQWIGQSDEFWYRRETATGSEFDIVNAATGRRRVAFDHEAIARALSSATGSAIAADHLPFTSVTFTAARDRIHVEVGDKQYDCDLAVGALHRRCARSVTRTIRDHVCDAGAHGHARAQ